MPIFVTFISPDPAADAAFAVVDVKSGLSWSPSKGVFASAPPDELVTMVRDPSPNRVGLRYGVSAAPDPPSQGQYVVQFHPPGGGPLLSQPVRVEGGAIAARTLNLAVSFRP